MPEKKNVPQKIRGQSGEIVRKVKHSSVRIENPLSALYRGTEYFSLARTFRTAWGGGGTIRNLTQAHGLLSNSPEVCRLLVGKAAIDRCQ